MNESAHTVNTYENVKAKRSYGEDLNIKRVEAAHEKILLTIDRRLKRVNDYPLDFLSEQYHRSMTDTFYSCSSLLELQELNLIDLVTSLPPRESVGFSESWSDGVVQKLGTDKFGIKINRDSKELKTISHSIKESVETSDMAITINEAYEHYKNNNGEITRSNFTIKDNPLVNGSLFEVLEIENYKSLISSINDSETLNLDSITSLKIQTELEKYANYDELGRILSIKLPFNSAVQLEMIPASDNPINGEITSIPWNMKFKPDAKSLMLEKASLGYDLCNHFLDREMGKNFVSALEYSGMKFSNMFEDFLTSNKLSSEFDDRYGGAYTQMSRVLAKIIFSNNMDKINSIFSTDNNDDVNRDNLKQFCNYSTSNKSLLVFQNILSQLIDRDNDQNYVRNGTDISMHLKGGACFDVASYYVEANNLNELKMTNELGITFLKKFFGSETLINSTEVLFNGIWLPRGSLFVEGKDEKLAFLRLTPFMFESRKDMVDAFGTEVLKAEHEGNLDDVVYKLKTIVN